jgi:UDP-glucose 4-epimerase
VTGGCGFIGGHLVDALVGLGASVRVIDDLSSSTVEHLAGMLELEPERVEFIHGSILDHDALDDAIRGCDTVFHLAAMGSVPRSIREPVRTWQVNATGTLRVLEQARSHLVSRVVYSASSSAYGNGPLGMSHAEAGASARVETQAPDPRSPYAASKLAAEQLCRSWSETYGLSTACLRYFNIFGPRQPGDSAYAAVIPAFLDRVLAGKPPLVEGDGQQTRDFTHVSNAVAANILAATSTDDLRGEPVNIGAGACTTVLDLATRITEACDRADLTPQHIDARPGDVRGSVADLTRARGLLGYRPTTAFEDGLAETVAWYRGQADEQPDENEQDPSASSGSFR